METCLSTLCEPSTYKLGGRLVRRMAYGAMRLAGPAGLGPPRDRAAALSLLREALAAGVDHIDTSDAYGPHIMNQLIQEALAPYPSGLCIATKVGARRADDGSWLPPSSSEELARAVDDNLRNLGVEALEVVNLRIMFATRGLAEGSVAAPMRALAALQQQRLVRHIGVSNATARQVEEARGIAPIVCVHNTTTWPTVRTTV